MEAVKNNGISLQYTNKELQNDKKIVRKNLLLP